MKNILRSLFVFKKQIFLIVIFVMTQIFSTLLLPTLMSKIVDVGIYQKNINYIFTIGFYMLIITFIGSAASICVSYIAAKVSSSISKDLRASLFEKAINFNVSDFDNVGVSSLITRTTNDITQIQTFIVILLRVIIIAPFMFVGSVFMATTKNLQMSAVILVSIPFIFLVVYVISKKGFFAYDIIQKGIDKINTISREKLTGIRVIRSFNKDDYEKNRFNDCNIDLTSISIKINRIIMLIMPLLTLILNVTVIAVIYFGAIEISNASIQVGDLIAFIQYIQQIMIACLMVSMIFVLLPKAMVSMNRIYEVIDMPHNDFIQNLDFESDINVGDIEFKNVSFKFDGSDKNALNNLNMKIKSGQMTAIVGSTGSGKSSIVKLISGLYSCTEGEVLIDGKNIRSYSNEKLRKSISYVPQKAVLFSGTVESNLKYGNDKASEQEMIQALQSSMSYDFVMNNKDGLGTSVSQGGTNFSGGQKQRLSIARALIKQSKIYIFDDSFSALDYKTDLGIRKNIQENLKDCTLIIVAQRIRTVMNAEHIIVLDDGNIVDQGTHEELLNNCSVYKEIVSSQLSKEGN